MFGFEHEQGRLETGDAEILAQQLLRSLGWGEEEGQQHELAVLLAAKEQPPQRQLTVGALEDAAVMQASWTVEVAFQPTAPAGVVGEQVVGQVTVDLTLEGRLGHGLAVDSDLQPLAWAVWVGVDVDALLAADVVQGVGEGGRTSRLQIAEDLDNGLNEVRLAGAVAAEQHRGRLALVEVDLEPAQVAVVREAQAIQSHAAASRRRGAVEVAPCRSSKRPRASSSFSWS